MTLDRSYAATMTVASRARSFADGVRKEIGREGDDAGEEGSGPMKKRTPRKEARWGDGRARWGEI